MTRVTARLLLALEKDGAEFIDARSGVRLKPAIVKGNHYNEKSFTRDRYGGGVVIE